MRKGTIISLLVLALIIVLVVVLTWKPAPAEELSILITPAVPGATVGLNGNDLGVVQTNFCLNDLAEGYHSVYFTHDGITESFIFILHDWYVDYGESARKIDDLTVGSDAGTVRFGCE